MDETVTGSENIQHLPTSTASTSTDSGTSPRKKQRRLQKYRVEWEKDHAWLGKVHDNEYKANCIICRRVFSIAHGGIHDLKQHASGTGHVERQRANQTRGSLDRFVVHQATPEADMVRTSGYGNVQ